MQEFHLGCYCYCITVSFMSHASNKLAHVFHQQDNQTSVTDRRNSLEWHRGLKHWKYGWICLSFSQSYQTARSHPCPQWSTWTLLTPYTASVGSIYLCCSKPKQLQIHVDTAKPKLSSIAASKMIDEIFLAREHVWHPRTVSKGGFLLISAFFHLSINILLNLHSTCLLKFLHHQFCPFIMPTLKSSILPIFLTLWRGHVAFVWLFDLLLGDLQQGSLYDTNPSNTHIIRKNHPQTDQHQRCINFDSPPKMGGIFHDPWRIYLAKLES